MTDKNKPEPKHSSESCVDNSYLVLPEHANAVGTIFGGTIVSWIDIIAAICAQRHCRKISVTASIDALNFLNPVFVGDTVNLCARVVYTGRTSMMIYVDVTAENPIKNQQPRRCVDAYLTFVALDENRKPAAVPPLLLKTEEEKAAFERAAKRRESLIAQKASEEHKN